ncbi:hypothetical protein GE21DRAFT_1306617 [Neurospora crassa]|nr:hypothetical protein GE21DRAFT_1306617 [Neurospora crassa]
MAMDRGQKQQAGRLGDLPDISGGAWNPIIVGSIGFADRHKQLNHDAQPCLLSASFMETTTVEPIGEGASVDMSIPHEDKRDIAYRSLLAEKSAIVARLQTA